MTVDGVTGVVEQSLEYLPSGYVCHSENYGRQPFRFCGKELLTMHGWDMYDSFARFQHDYLPRFTQMDPLAEKYYHASPYNYAGCDPVNAVDPSGKDVYIFDSSGNLLQRVENNEYDQVVTLSGDPLNSHINWGPKLQYNSIGFIGDTRYKNSFMTIVLFSGMGRVLFDFLSKHTSVEWAYIRTIPTGGHSLIGNEYLTTSHDPFMERSSYYLYSNFFLNTGEDVVENSHSHNESVPYPSGLLERNNDIGFANTVNMCFHQYPKFYIYLPASGIYIEYNGNSTIRDFPNVPLYEQTLGEPATVVGKRKRK